MYKPILLGSVASAKNDANNSFLHTFAGGTSPVGLAFVNYYSTNNAQPTGMTYDGVAMTLFGSHAFSWFGGTFDYYILSEDMPKTAGNYAVAMSGTPSHRVVSFAAYGYVAQQAPVDTDASDTTSGSSQSTKTLTASVANSLFCGSGHCEATLSSYVQGNQATLYGSNLVSAVNSYSWAGVVSASGNTAVGINWSAAAFSHNVYAVLSPLAEKGGAIFWYFDNWKKRLTDNLKKKLAFPQPAYPLDVVKGGILI